MGKSPRRFARFHAGIDPAFGEKRQGQIGHARVKGAVQLKSEQAVTAQQAWALFTEVLARQNIRVVAEAAGRGRLTVRTRTGSVAGSTP